MTNIETLRQLILTGKVPAGTLDFASNLVSSFDKYGIEWGTKKANTNVTVSLLGAA